MASTCIDLLRFNDQKNKRIAPCEVRSRKRKSSTERGSSKKKGKRSCEAGSVFVENVSAGPSKRKASPENDSQRGRKKGTSDTSKPSDGLVEQVCTSRGTGKRKASPGAETSRKKRKNYESQQTCTTSCPEEGDDKRLPEVNTSRADFEAKYQELHKLGEGGCALVFAGIRIADSLPVAIKHIKGPDEPQGMGTCKIPREVALMWKAAGGPESVGKYAAVTLLDWYILDQELILVMERPVPSMNLLDYLKGRGGCLEECEAKVLMAQLVAAAVEMHSKGVFHRDIKSANVLVEVGSSIPRVRIIDFGCGSMLWKKSYRVFSGTISLAPPEWYHQKRYKAGPTMVWQLGALLYRMVHGTKFDTLSFLTGMISFNKKLSENCRDFIKLCLTKHPKNRGTLEQLQRHPWLQTTGHQVIGLIKAGGRPEASTDSDLRS